MSYAFGSHKFCHIGNVLNDGQSNLLDVSIERYESYKAMDQC